MGGGSESERSDWLGGAPADLALSVGGVYLSYADFTARVTDAIHQFGDAELVVVRTGDPLAALTGVYAALTAGRPMLITDPELPVPDLTDIPAGAELLVTTSGSTGRPRVIARTWESWRLSLAPFTELTGLTSADTVAFTGPLHASLQLFGALHTLSIGATLIDAAANATAAHCVPSTLDALVRAGSTIRLAVVAGAALTSGLADRARAQGIEIVEYYGAAELSFVAARRYRRPMVAFPGVELEIRDGVIWARSPYLALGYAGEPGALRVDEDGFASVGDMGAFEGRTLSIRGRTDAAVTTSGATVIAEDIEAILAEAPGVLAAAVVGLPHERLGEIVVAVLELEPDASGRDIRVYARARLQSAALPRRWFVSEIPIAAGGKVARGAIRRGLINGSLGAQPLT